MADADQLVASDVGEIPASWQVLRFGDLVETRLGKMLSPKARTGTGSRPYLRNANLQWDRIHTDDLLEMDFSEEERQKFRLVPGDLLICEGGEVGRAAIWRGELDECYYQKAIHRVRPKDGRVANEFLLYHFMNAFLLHDTYGTQGTETTIAHLPAVKLRALPVPVPPPEEQRAIAHVLRTVQRAKEAAEAVVAAARQLKRSLLRHLFTYGPVPVEQADRVPLKDTEIGPIPEQWELSRCGELCDPISVGVVVKPASHYVPAGVPAFRSFNVREDRLVPNDLVYFSAEVNNGKLAKSKLRTGDVLIVRTGYPGTSCVVPAEYDGANCIDLVFARPRLPLGISSYLSRFFNSDSGKKQAQAAKIGLAQQHHNVGAVKQTLIPLPPITEQKRIADMLGAVDEKIACEVDRVAALDALFKSLLRDLMTGRVRVGDLDLPIPTGGGP